MKGDNHVPKRKKTQASPIGEPRNEETLQDQNGTARDTDRAETQETAETRAITGEVLPDLPAEYQDETRYRRLKNGAIYDNQVNRIVANPPGGPTTGIKTQSQAVALANRRHVIAAQAELAGRSGLRRLSSKKSSLDAWSNIVEARGKEALNGKGRSAVENASFVGRATGFLRDSRQSPDPPQAGAVLSMSPDVAERLIELLAGKMQDGE